MCLKEQTRESVKFKDLSNMLWGLDPSDQSFSFENKTTIFNLENDRLQFVSAVADNLKYFSKAQNNRAKRQEKHIKQ